MVGDVIVAFVASDTDDATAYTSPAITAAGMTIPTTTLASGRWWCVSGQRLRYRHLRGCYHSRYTGHGSSGDLADGWSDRPVDQWPSSGCGKSCLPPSPRLRTASTVTAPRQAARPWPARTPPTASTSQAATSTCNCGCGCSPPTPSPSGPPTTSCSSLRRTPVVCGPTWVLAPRSGASTQRA